MSVPERAAAPDAGIIFSYMQRFALCPRDQPVAVCQGIEPVPDHSTVR
jgi:hypothetical protein